jgi:peptidoglycan/LPS O-acetylase OafA/YrhL
MPELQPTPAPRGHFLVLDALRGVAALAVMLMHRGEAFNGVGVLPHAYLAVDFFFLLSGLVIAYSYEARLVGGAMSARVRLIRLYPLILAAAAVSIGYMAIRQVLAPDGQAAWTLLEQGFAAAVLLPTLTGPAAAEYAYPINTALWSLFFEVAVSFAYVLLLPWLTRRVLVALVAASGAILVLVAFTAGNLDLGATPQDFWLGAVRASFSFFAGVLMFRLFRHRPVDGAAAPLALAALLVALFCVPRGAGDSLFDLACVLLVFPAVLWFAAQQTFTAGAGACRLLGGLSYPLYVLHLPVIVWCEGMAKQFGLGQAGERPLLTIAAWLVAAAAAWAALKLYDEPVRRALTSRARPAAPAKRTTPTPRRRTIARIAEFSRRVRPIG